MLPQAAENTRAAAAAARYIERMKALQIDIREACVPNRASHVMKPSRAQEYSGLLPDCVVMTEKSRLTPFLAYVVVFHLAWIAWPFVVYPRLETIGNATLLYALLNIALRLLLWVAPVLLYLRYVDGVEPFGYLGLRRHVKRGMVVAAVLTAMNLIGSIVRFGPPHPVAQSITWNSVLGTSFMVGFIEEIPYRGFMLLKLAERVNFWLANAITSLLFVAIHVPGWIALHTLSAPKAVEIFIFGAVMAAVSRWSGSLWAPIITHSANDFISFILFRV